MNQKELILPGAELSAPAHKYILLRQWLMECIENRVYRFGDKLPSENMLCNKFSISRQTVRNAIVQLEQEGLVRRVRGSGTFVNCMVEQKPRNKTIGVLLSYLDDYIFPPIIQGIEEVLSRNGYGIDFGVSHNRVENEARFLERILESNVAGLIVEGTRTALPRQNLKLFERLRESGVPVMFIHSVYPELDFPSVLMNDRDCVCKMTRMLIEAGHKNIAGIFKVDDIQGHWRFEGYAQAMRLAGLPVMEEHIKWFSTEDYKRTGLFRDEHVFRKFMGDCTALVCYNDQIAASVCELLCKLGLRVPEDLSLVGFDDSIYANNGRFQITSARHPKKELGRQAAQRLLTIIEQGGMFTKEDSFLFPSEITVRHSIGAPGRGQPELVGTATQQTHI